ncbi:hypothetical protein IW262DRAFT_347899 [Armillaria fumosa]|nr:hypothetical protein IW262DRAFT_347899 [Armillaria fumosa]
MTTRPAGNAPRLEIWLHSLRTSKSTADFLLHSCYLCCGIYCGRSTKRSSEVELCSLHAICMLGLGTMLVTGSLPATEEHYTNVVNPFACLLGLPFPGDDRTTLLAQPPTSKHGDVSPRFLVARLRYLLRQDNYEILRGLFLSPPCSSLARGPVFFSPNFLVTTTSRTRVYVLQPAQHR